MNKYQVVEVDMDSGRVSDVVVAKLVFAKSEHLALTAFYRSKGRAWVRANIHQLHRAIAI